jgi:hypothetical protein
MGVLTGEKTLDIAVGDMKKKLNHVAKEME